MNPSDAVSRIVNEDLYDLFLMIPHGFQKRIEGALHRAYEYGLSQGYANCLHQNREMAENRFKPKKEVRTMELFDMSKIMIT